MITFQFFTIQRVLGNNIQVCNIWFNFLFYLSLLKLSQAIDSAAHTTGETQKLRDWITESVSGHAGVQSLLSPVS